MKKTLLYVASALALILALTSCEEEKSRCYYRDGVFIGCDLDTTHPM